MPTTPPIGLPDRFRIDQEIGRGGMAVVYRAHDRHLDRFVAIKVLSEHLSHSVGVERFQREIALMAKLVHPGIVALFDSGEAAGRLYYVMPFVAGENLRARLTREHRMAVADAVGFAADVAEALAFAHGAGIVHRDVKPENIFTVEGRAVLADFGIAHIAGDASGADANLTRAGMVLGTASYMSPEQAGGEATLDGRSDLYSLGCVLYELLTGKPPFTGATPMGIVAKHLTETPVPAREVNPGITPAVEAIVMRLLEKEPGKRPGTAGDVARLLRDARQTGETLIVAAPPREADRLVDDGLQAIYHSVSAGPGARNLLAQAEVYLNRAMTLEPKHARGLTAMATLIYTKARIGLTSQEEAFVEGRNLVLEALAADDRCADVHDALGKIALYHDDDCWAAARHIDRAVALNPEDAEAHRFQSIVYKVLGRTEDAIRAAKAATVKGPQVAVVWNALGDALLSAGRNAEATVALKRAVSLQPGYGPALERLEIAHIRLGEADLALEIRASRLRASNRPTEADRMLAHAAEHGPLAAIHHDLRRELDQLLRAAETTDPFASYWLARTPGDQIVVVAAALGDWKTAMDWVEKAYQRRPIRLRRLLTEPPFDRRGLAIDPRYARLLRVAVIEDLL